MSRPSSVLTTDSTLSPLGLHNITREQIESTEEDKALVDWVYTCYNRAKSARQPIERQWDLNMAFYRAKQWVSFSKALPNSPVAGRLVEPPRVPWRSRPVINRCRGIVRTEISKMISTRPTVSIIPASSEDEDLFAAQAGEQVFESLYESLGILAHQTQAAFWTSVCGVGYLKNWWDPNGTDANGYKGTIKVAALAPHYVIVPDLTEFFIENQPWVINAYTKPVEWVKSFCGKDFSPTVVSADSLMSNSFLDLGGEDKKPDSCFVIEMWIKPGAHKDFPDGGLVTIIDRTLIYKHKSWPYAHQEYPFIKYDHVLTGGYYSASILEDAIPLQRELNRLRGSIADARKRLGMPKIWYTQGSLDPRKITSEPGQMIPVKPGFGPPQQFPIAQIPNFVLQEVDRTLSDLEDITSQHEVSRGSAPPGVTAATAISYLQEKDDSVMTTTYHSVEFGTQKLGRHLLSHVVEFWETERVIKTTGVDGTFDSICLKGSTLKSAQDIRTEAGSALPQSKAAKQAFIMDLMTKGFIPPQEGLRIMEMGGINKIYERLKGDERQAQRENVRMRNLTVQQIEQHLQDVMMRQQVQQQLANMMAPPMMPEAPLDGSDGGMTMPAVGGPPPGMDQAMGGMPGQMPGMEAEKPLIPGELQDMNSGMQLLPSPSILPVNTWDNHAIHIQVHNEFRKSQGFERLDPSIKEQFEYHVSLHSQALNQAATQAAMTGQPPMGDPSMEVGPDGSNQFGPPGTIDGSMPPMEGMI